MVRFSVYLEPKFKRADIFLGTALAISTALSSITMASISTMTAPLPVLTKEMEMKDLDDVLAMAIKFRDRNLHMEDKDEELRVNFFDAVRAIFARRDYDGARSKIMNSLRSSLADDEMDVMERVVEDSVEALKNGGSPVQTQKTHYTILHNFIKEYQGRKKDYAPQFARIRDANIRLSDELKKENRLSTMTDNDSPSKAAARVVGEKEG
jgi:hypothetical protein